MHHKIPLAKKRAAAKKRADMSPLVVEYVKGLIGWKQDVAETLREVIRAASRELTEEVKWGWPCYTAGGKHVCGFMDMKETVNFVLYLGAEPLADELSDPDVATQPTPRYQRFQARTSQPGQGHHP